MSMHRHTLTNSTWVGLSVRSFAMQSHRHVALLSAMVHRTIMHLYPYPFGYVVTSDRCNRSMYPTYTHGYLHVSMIHVPMHLVHWTCHRTCSTMPLHGIDHCQWSNPCNSIVTPCTGRVTTPITSVASTRQAVHRRVSSIHGAYTYAP